MKEDQIKALKSLERAFRKCKEAGIAFYGMDCALYAISEDKVNTNPRKHGQCNSQDNVHDSLNEYGYDVNTHGAYSDSGGF